MSIRSIFSFLGLSKKQNAPAISAGMRIVFHQDARGFGQHGVIIATHVDHALNKEPVRFTFPGINTAPELTPELIQYIWYKAEVEGFIVHSLSSYGSVMGSVKATKMSDVVSQTRQDAESRFPIGTGGQLPPKAVQEYVHALAQNGEPVMFEDATNGKNLVGIAVPVAGEKAPPINPPLHNTQQETKTPVMA